MQFCSETCWTWSKSSLSLQFCRGHQSAIPESPFVGFPCDNWRHLLSLCSGLGKPWRLGKLTKVRHGTQRSEELCGRRALDVRDIPAQKLSQLAPAYKRRINPPLGFTRQEVVDALNEQDGKQYCHVLC